MRMAMWVMVPVAMIAASGAAAGAQDVAVRALVDRFQAARLAHDPAALERTLAPDYEEISPVGEVDPRAKVLSFYVPELKKPAPTMTDDEVAVRSTGDIAIVTLRTSFTRPDATRRSIRVRYVARRAKGAWLLVSAQYTPIPPARPS